MFCCFLEFFCFVVVVVVVFYKRTVIKELAIVWVLCDRLHAQLSSQSLLMAMLHSLIARRRFGPQTQ